MHLLDAHEPAPRGGLTGRGLREDAARGDHRVEQRQRDRGPEALQGRAAREMLLRQIHHWVPSAMAVRNAGLRTTPRISADMR